MNKDWSEKNKEIQKLLGKESGYKEGINKLIDFRGELFNEIERLQKNYSTEDFHLQPFLNAKGYHSKTLAYSIWHIFRIEDIVAHSLIEKNQQVLFGKNYGEKIGTQIITTGNEFQGQQISDFSKQLKINQLIKYAKDVMVSTNKLMTKLDYSQMKNKFSQEEKDELIKSGCVSSSEDAFWLIDYWCSKDVRGLIKMPFSRHWIMHIEAMLRIESKLK